MVNTKRNDIAMEFDLNDFIYLRPGEYTIGIDPSHLESIEFDSSSRSVKRKFVDSSCPAHAVGLEGVYIARDLITFRQFSRFAEDAGYATEAEVDGWAWIWEEGWKKRTSLNWRRPFSSERDRGLQQRADTPVLQISWNDAMEYCRWLSSQTGRSVRLPLEAEWEVFSRLSGFRSMTDLSYKEENLSDNQEFLVKLRKRGEHSGNSIGLVWEWTLDWYTGYPGGKESREYGETYKVLRGGSLMSHPIQRTREFRLRKCPTARSPYYGFRIALADVTPDPAR